VFARGISPLTLIALLFHDHRDVLVQGEKIIQLPFDVIRIAVPLALYFRSCGWSRSSSPAGWSIRTRRRHRCVHASSNDFELAIAVAVAMFGITSGQPSPR